jgi:hypothetical protein
MSRQSTLWLVATVAAILVGGVAPSTVECTGVPPEQAGLGDKTLVALEGEVGGLLGPTPRTTFDRAWPEKYCFAKRRVRGVTRRPVGPFVAPALWGEAGAPPQWSRKSP